MAVSLRRLSRKNSRFFTRFTSLPSYTALRCLMGCCRVRSKGYSILFRPSGSAGALSDEATDNKARCPPSTLNPCASACRTSAFLRSWFSKTLSVLTFSSSCRPSLQAGGSLRAASSRETTCKSLFSYSNCMFKRSVEGIFPSSAGPSSIVSRDSILIPCSL